MHQKKAKRSDKSVNLFPALIFFLKFGYSEKAKKFEKIFNIKFDATQ